VAKPNTVRPRVIYTSEKKKEGRRKSLIAKRPLGEKM